MKDEEKQIEEMASDMDYACTKRDLYPSDAKEIAKALYLLGYQKIDKDSIVLSRAELENMVNAKMKCINDMAIIAQKETAESLLSELYYIVRFYYGDSANVLAWAKDKAKSLGVEIKE